MSVRAHEGEGFLNFDNGTVFVLLEDGRTSPNSWECSVFVGNMCVRATFDGMTLEETAEHAADYAAELFEAFREMSDFLRAYMASCAESEGEGK